MEKRKSSGNNNVNDKIKLKERIGKRRKKDKTSK